MAAETFVESASAPGQDFTIHNLPLGSGLVDGQGPGARELTHSRSHAHGHTQTHTHT